MSESNDPCDPEPDEAVGQDDDSEQDPQPRPTDDDIGGLADDDGGGDSKDRGPVRPPCRSYDAGARTR